MTDQFRKTLHNLCNGVIPVCRTCALKAKAFFAVRATQRFSNFPLQGFNLLPYRHLRALRCRSWRRSEFALAACTGLLIASVVQYHQASNANRVAQNEKNLQQQLNTLQPQLAESQSLNALIATQQRRMKALASLTPERLALTTLLNALAQFKEAREPLQNPLGGVMPPSSSLSTNVLAAKPCPQRVLQRSPNVRVTQLKIEPGLHTILGIASDYAALSQWVQFLKQTALFANVKVAQVQHRAPPNTQVQTITPAGLTFSVNLSAASSAHTNPSRSDLSQALKKIPVTQPNNPSLNYSKTR